MSAALVERSWTLAGLNRLRDALADANAAIKLDPKLPGPYFARANAESSKGQYDEAISDLTESLLLDPNQAGPLQLSRRGAQPQKRNAKSHRRLHRSHSH